MSSATSKAFQRDADCERRGASDDAAWRFDEPEVFLPIVAGVCLSVYLITMSQTIAGGDAGELAGAVCGMTVAHPPGYPLFTGLYHTVWSIVNRLIPGVRPVRVFNAFSSVLSALAATIFGRSVHRFTRNGFVAMLMSFVYAFSGNIWSYASQSEVFPLHNLILSCILSLTVDIVTKERTAPVAKLITFGSYMCGLAMTNQHTSLLVIAPIAIAFVVKYPVQRKPAMLLINACAFIVGLLPYVILIANANKYRSWGETNSIMGLISHILRFQYGTFRLAAIDLAVDGEYLSRLLLFANHIVNEISTLHIAVMFIAIWRHRNSPVVRTVFFALIFNVLTFNWINNMKIDSDLLNGVQERFYQQPFMLICFLAAIGWNDLMTRNTSRISLVLVASLISQMAANWLQHDLHHSDIIDRLGRGMLDFLPADSVVLASGDLIIHPLLYLQACERVRPDVRVVPSPLLMTDWFLRSQEKYIPEVLFPGPYMHVGEGGFKAIDLLEYNIGDSVAGDGVDVRPFFSCGGVLLPSGEDAKLLNQRFTNRHAGFCSQLLPQSAGNSNVTDVLRSSFERMPDLGPFLPEAYTSRSWNYEAFRFLWLRQAKLFEQMYSAITTMNAVDLLPDAANLAQRILDDTATIPLYTPKLSSEFLNRAADIFGLLSRKNKTPFEELMYQMMSLSIIIQPDPKIERLLQSKMNPYTASRSTIAD